jgi:undecaprenyl-diphosphatase
MDIFIIFIAKYLVFVAAAIALIYFLKQAREKQKEILIFAVILLPLSYIIAKIFGHFYFDPRPFVAQNFTPLLPHAADNGFPSDHTLFGAAIAFAVFRFNKKLGTILLCAAFLVGVARVLAGVHHFIDIAGSIFLVWAVYVFVSKFLFKAKTRT